MAVAVVETLPPQHILAISAEQISMEAYHGVSILPSKYVQFLLLRDQAMAATYVKWNLRTVALKPVGDIKFLVCYFLYRREKRLLSNWMTHKSEKAGRHREERDLLMI